MTGIIIAVGLIIIVFGFSAFQKVIYRRNWAKNLTFRLSSSNSAVFEGEKAVLIDSITNNKWLPLPWIHISYSLSNALAYLDNTGSRVDPGNRRSMVIIVGVKKTVSRKSTVLCSKRGHYQAADLVLMSNNPLMTNMLSEARPLRFSLLVYPRLVDYPESVIPLRKLMGELQVRRFIDPDPFTFKGIREYQSYDSFRQINWRATAKTGELMSNIYDFTVSQDITVLLNLQRYSEYKRDFVYEEAIRLAAFICRQCVSMGIPVSLVCPAGDGKPVRISSGVSGQHLTSIYTALAYIDLRSYNASISGYMLAAPEKAFVLISPFHEQDFYESFAAMRDRSAGASWIIPFYGKDTISVASDDDIIKLEVYEDDAQN